MLDIPAILIPQIQAEMDERNISLYRMAQELGVAQPHLYSVLHNGQRFGIKFLGAVLFNRPEWVALLNPVNGSTGQELTNVSTM